MKDVFYWRYTLRSAAPLNARSGCTEHEGALIRVGDGFGCIHPWPEFGDARLEEQLSRLARGDRTALTEQALRCAAIDGEARREGRSLFDPAGEDPIGIPASHLLATGCDSPAEGWEAGFRSVKHKVGPGLSGLAERLRPWAEAGFRLRLDANESVPAREWRHWWSELPGPLREPIEFIEDPCPWSESDWRDLRDRGLPVAVDRELAARRSVADRGVYKPAVDCAGVGSSERERAASADEPCASSARTRSLLLPLEEALVAEGRQVVVTSCMDHAIGQSWAAHRAGILSREALGPVADCGLLTHRCFEPDAFFERLRCEGPRLLPPAGTGLGFDDLLEELPWKRLS